MQRHVVISITYMGNFIRFWRSCLDPLVYLHTKHFNYLAFQSFDYLVKIIPETPRAH